MKNRQQLRGMILLLVTAAIWGTAFVAQSVGLEHLGTFTFNGIRTFIGCVVLSPFILYGEYKVKKFTNPEARKKENRALLIGGLICGVMLCIATNLQQLGIIHSTVGKSAFITTLYIVLVPILGLFLKRRVSIPVWIGVVVAMIGLYLLCMKDEQFTLGLGDVYLLLCAFFFSLQIIAVDHFSPKVSGLKLSFAQLLVTAVLSGILALLTETPSMEDITAAAFPLFYAGAVSCGIAYTLQIVGQKDVNPAVSSLILSLESVIASLGGWVILHEVLTTQELIGCGLVFGAVLITQLPAPSQKQNDF